MNATLGYHDQTLQGRRMDFFDTFLNETPWHSTFDWTPVVEKHHGGQILEVKIRLEPVERDTSAESEKRDVSLTTGPTRRPFGRASIYGGRVKTYLVKSRGASLEKRSVQVVCLMELSEVGMIGL